MTMRKSRREGGRKTRTGKASFPQTGVLLREARHRYCKQSSKGLSRDDPGQAEGEGLPQCQGMQVTLVRSSLHSCNLLSRTIPRKAPGATILLYTTLWPSRGCPGLLPDTCPAQPPLLSPSTERWGWQSRQGSRRKAKPLESSAPHGYFLSLPNKQGSQMLPLQGHAAAPCREGAAPSFAEGRAAREQGWNG